MSNDAEYQSLRNELLAISSRQFSMLTFAFTATAALIGLGVNSENNKSLIVLTSLIILGFAGVQLVSHAYSTMRIATFIYYFIEPGNEDLNWETYMREYRNEIRQHKYNILSKFSWPSYEMLLIVVGWICVIIAGLLSFQQNAQFYKIAVILIVGFLWLLFSIWLRLRMNAAASGELDKELQSAWKAVASKRPGSDLDSPEKA